MSEGAAQQKENRTYKAGVEESNWFKGLCVTFLPDRSASNVAVIGTLPHAKMPFKVSQIFF